MPTQTALSDIVSTWGDDVLRETLAIRLEAGATPIQLAREMGVGKRQMQRTLARLGLSGKRDEI